MGQSNVFDRHENKEKARTEAPRIKPRLFKLFAQGYTSPCTQSARRQAAICEPRTR